MCVRACNNYKMQQNASKICVCMYIKLCVISKLIFLVANAKVEVSVFAEKKDLI